LKCRFAAVDGRRLLRGGRESQATDEWATTRYRRWGWRMKG
jgi:hypothetical protein